MKNLKIMEHESDKRVQRPPLGFIILIIITALTGLLWVPLGRYIPDDFGENQWILTMLYPIYSLLSVYLAYRSYAERPVVAWILVSLVWIAFGGEFALLFI